MLQCSPSTRITQRGVPLGLLIFSAELAGCASFNSAEVVNGFPAALERQQALEAARAAEPAQPEVGFEELMTQADQRRDQNKISEAALLYIRALGLEPGSSAPRQRLAFMHLENDPAHAQMIFEQLLQSDPNSADAYTGLGLAQMVLGDVEPARDSLESAISLGATTGRPAAALGVIYDRLGEFSVAQGHYRQALELEPGNADTLNNLGTSQMLDGEFGAAVGSFERALRRRPGDFAFLNNLGLAHGRLGQYAQARDAFEKADTDAAINNLGYVLSMNGEFAQAIEHYEQALLSGRGDRLTVLQNLHAAQLELYGKWEPTPEPAPVAVPKKPKTKVSVAKPRAKRDAALDQRLWLQ